MKALFVLAGILVLTLGGIYGWMRATQRFCPEPRTPEDLRDPVLAIELARTAGEVRGVLGDPDGRRNRAVMRGQMFADGFFIACYAECFALLAVVTFCSRRARFAGAVALLAALGAGVFDVVEDLGILRTLDTDPDQLTDAMVASTRHASLAKWLLVGVVETALSRLFLGFRGEDKGRRAVSWAVGVSLLIAAAFQFAGLFRHGLIAVSFLFLVLALVGDLLILAAGPGRFLDGVAPAPAAGGGSAS
jgi:hypothetical protein